MGTEGRPTANVLLVDDDEQVLAGLSMWLRRKRPAWNVITAESGVEALAAIRQHPPDVIISDFHMPGMNGLELLSSLHMECPEVGRILFSGYADAAAPVGLAAHAQARIDKPCPPGEVIATVDRALTLSRKLASPRLREAARDVQVKIARWAPNYERLRLLASAADTTATSLGVALEEFFPDSRPWLERAHLGLMGTSSPNVSIATLAERIGPLAASCVALQAELRSSSVALHDASGALASHKRPRTDLEGWHALVTGCFAAGLLQQDERPDAAFAAGLLHDLSKGVEACAPSESLQTVRRLIEEEDATELEAERATYGASHPEIAAAVARDWGLPFVVVEAILFHHEPEKSTEETFGATGAVHVADSIDAEQFRKQIDQDVDAPERPRCGRPQLEYLDRVQGKSRLLEWVRLGRGVEQLTALDGHRL